MSARLAVPCPLCGAEHTCTVSDGEPMVRHHGDGSGHPGSGPEVDWRSEGCECGSHPVVDELAYWDAMNEAAIEKSRRVKLYSRETTDDR